MEKKYFIITSALPYANGSIHLGHMVEYIQTDIYARFHKMLKERTVLYFCADDTHGAPIMIRARKEKIPPEKLIERYHKEHLADFERFGIEFDNYHSTNSVENKEISESIFLRLKERGHIVKKKLMQTFCEHDRIFLPDRFVRGICPKCKKPDQYGDSCEACGSQYSPTDLINPVCSICANKPTRKESEHYFFKVSDLKDQIIKFMESDALQDEVKNYLKKWIEEGLKDWDITRDGPYFGFLIPGETDKYFYVWLDAPIGYISSAKNYADKNKIDIDKLWKNEETRIEHFIGKDILYFHTLFWIATLKASGYKIPDKIRVHGFLTANGEKMSKSKGTFIKALDYLEYLDPEHLRFYYATKLRNSIDDIDLNFDDFLFRTNAEMVNKIANLGSRVISIFNKNESFLDTLGDIEDDGKPILENIKSRKQKIISLYSEVEFGKMMKEVISFADDGNLYIDQKKPWDIKDDPEKLRDILTTGINIFKNIVIYLKPVIPSFAKKVEKILNCKPFGFDDIDKDLLKVRIGRFERLTSRIEKKNIEQLLLKNLQAADQKNEKSTQDQPDESSSEIDFDQFAKVDLRTAKIVEALAIKGKDKLLKLTVSLGNEKRTIVAGIALYYKPEELIGRNIVIVANLKPRKLAGIESEGMLLAVNDSNQLSLIGFDKDMKENLKVS